MAVETTGILTVELDTSKINQQAKDLQNNINKLTIIPPIKISANTTKIKADIKDLQSRFSDLNKVTITPKITADPTGLTPERQKEAVEKIISVVQKYEKQLERLRGKLQYASREGEKFYVTNFNLLNIALEK